MLGRLRGYLKRRARLGPRGERHAARYLRRLGYRILHRNLSAGGLEADLIALAPDRATIVLVEVKTRQAAWPAPEESVDWLKQGKLLRLAGHLQNRGRYAGCAMRIDVVAIIWGKGQKPVVRHYEGAVEGRD